MEDLLLSFVTDHSAFLKLFVLWTCVLVGIPLAVLVTGVSKRVSELLLFLLVFLLCQPDLFGISFFGQMEYRASARSLEFHLSDFCAVVLALSIWLRPRGFKLKLLLPLLLPYTIYLGIAVLSWMFTPVDLPVPGPRRNLIMTAMPPDQPLFTTGIYPLFQLFRLVKGLLVFWVVAHAAQSRRNLNIIVLAMAASVACLSCVGLVDRYVYGVYRVSGGLLHPNDFGAYVAMAAAVLLPYIYYVRNTWLSVALVFLLLGALGCEILSVSRSGLLILVAAAVVATVYGLYRHYSRRNLIYVGLVCIACVVFAGIAYDTLIARFVSAGVEETVGDRSRLNSQGVYMARDHLFGVGLGNYSAFSWVKYADVVKHDDVMEPGLPAHNIWYLTLGELGWPGLLAFMLLWGSATRLIWQLWKRPLDAAQRTLLFGVILSLGIVHLESLVHFSYRNPAIYALMHVLLGVAVGLSSSSVREGRLQNCEDSVMA